MPYNNNPIPRTGSTTGSVSLPLARIKKIIQADDDVTCSANAAFAIAVATEEFIYYLTERAHMIAKADKKPKRSLGYDHVQQAVARIDNLEFLTDVVPRQQAFRDAKLERQKKKQAAQAAAQQDVAHANSAVANTHQTILFAPPINNGHRANGHVATGASHPGPASCNNGGVDMDVTQRPMQA